MSNASVSQKVAIFLFSVTLSQFRIEKLATTNWACLTFHNENKCSWNTSCWIQNYLKHFKYYYLTDTYSIWYTQFVTLCQNSYGILGISILNLQFFWFMFAFQRTSCLFTHLWSSALSMQIIFSAHVKQTAQNWP